MRYFLAVLDAIGAFIEYMLTRKCWVCGGTGVYDGETCIECQGVKRT